MLPKKQDIRHIDSTKLPSLQDVNNVIQYDTQLSVYTEIHIQD